MKKQVQQYEILRTSYYSDGDTDRDVLHSFWSKDAVVVKASLTVCRTELKRLHHDYAGYHVNRVSANEVGYINKYATHGYKIQPVIAATVAA